MSKVAIPRLEISSPIQSQSSRRNVNITNVTDEYNPADSGNCLIDTVSFFDLLGMCASPTNGLKNYSNPNNNIGSVGSHFYGANNSLEELIIAKAEVEHAIDIQQEDFSQLSTEIAVRLVQRTDMESATENSKHAVEHLQAAMVSCKQALDNLAKSAPSYSKGLLQEVLNATKPGKETLTLILLEQQKELSSQSHTIQILMEQRSGLEEAITANKTAMANYERVIHENQEAILRLNAAALELNNNLGEMVQQSASMPKYISRGNNQGLPTTARSSLDYDYSSKVGRRRLVNWASFYG